MFDVDRVHKIRDKLIPIGDETAQEGRGNTIKAVIDNASTYHEKNDRKAINPPRDKEKLLTEYKAVDIRELLTYEFPKRECILDPIFTLSSINMVFAWRGVGKTHFALGIAWAAASGGRFLKWQTSRPFKVLYLDGEMPGESLQIRLAEIGKSADSIPDEGYLSVCTIDMCGGIMPDLATYEGQAQISAMCEDKEIIIVDNISCLVRGDGGENDSKTWLEAQEWALSMRSKGKCVIFIHHAGKNGEQRGTSKKEDQLDITIVLKRPSDYEPNQGARFEVHFGKARHLTGDDAQAIEAWLTQDEKGNQAWTMKTLCESTLDRVVELANLGMSQTEIAIELAIHKSSVCRAYKRAVTDGLIKKESKQVKTTQTAQKRSDIDG